MIDGLSAAGQTFIEEMTKLTQRLDRLERIARLSLRSIADHTLERAKIIEYLNRRVGEDERFRHSSPRP
ncbi:MAG TPA: hypothetical protein VFH61_12210, partial [Thermoleophilia bacterium]|nr:hypothetical protein [Thermoleophilia bacterium]